MADADPTPATHDPILEEIRQAGESGDAATRGMFKGVTDALEKLASLVKAKAHEEPDGDEDGGGKPDGDGDEPDEPDEPPEKDDPAGCAYADMGKGGDLPPDALDATEWLFSVDQHVQGLQKAVTALRAENAEIRAMLGASIELQKALAAPLMKAVAKSSARPQRA